MHLANQINHIWDSTIVSTLPKAMVFESDPGSTPGLGNFLFLEVKRRN